MLRHTQRYFSKGLSSVAFNKKDFKYQISVDYSDNMVSVTHRIEVLDGNRFVGLISYDPFVATLRDLWIHPSYRGKRIGTQLFDHFLAVLETRRANWFNINTNQVISRNKQNELGIYLHGSSTSRLLEDFDNSESRTLGYLNPFVRHKFVEGFHPEWLEFKVCQQKDTFCPVV